MANKKIASVNHYYNKIGVAVIDLLAKLSVGDQIKIVGKKDEFTQTVKSLEVDHKKVKSAKKGDSVGFKVDQQVQKNDAIYKLS